MVAEWVVEVVDLMIGEEALDLTIVDNLTIETVEMAVEMAEGLDQADQDLDLHGDMKVDQTKENDPTLEAEEKDQDQMIVTAIDRNIIEEVETIVTTDILETEDL